MLLWLESGGMIKSRWIQLVSNQIEVVTNEISKQQKKVRSKQASNQVCLQLLIKHWNSVNPKVCVGACVSAVLRLESEVKLQVEVKRFGLEPSEQLGS